MASSIDKSSGKSFNQLVAMFNQPQSQSTVSIKSANRLQPANRLQQAVAAQALPVVAPQAQASEVPVVVTPPVVPTVAAPALVTTVAAPAQLIKIVAKKAIVPSKSIASIEGDAKISADLIDSNINKIRNWLHIDHDGEKNQLWKNVLYFVENYGDPNLRSYSNPIDIHFITKDSNKPEHLQGYYMLICPNGRSNVNVYISKKGFEKLLIIIDRHFTWERYLAYEEALSAKEEADRKALHAEKEAKSKAEKAADFAKAPKLPELQDEFNKLLMDDNFGGPVTSRVFKKDKLTIWNTFLKKIGENEFPKWFYYKFDGLEIIDYDFVFKFSHIIPTENYGDPQIVMSPKQATAFFQYLKTGKLEVLP